MNKHATTYEKHLHTILLTIIIILSIRINVSAAVYDISANNGETSTASVNVGDTGSIKPNLSYIEDQSAFNNFEYYFDSNNTEILTVDNNGAYTAVAPGTTSVNIHVYSRSSSYDEFYGSYYNTYSIFSATIQFTVNIDMTNVTLSTYDICSYMYPEYYYMSKPYYSSSNVTIAINSVTVISDPEEEFFTYTCSNPMLGIEAYLYDNTITIYQTTDTIGAGIITFNIYGKEFIVNYQSGKVDISDQSLLLVKKNKQKLTVTGYNGDIIWSSSNPSIATVDSNGVVKGKKIGNVIIKAQLGNHYLGCAVSVTTKKLKKVAERATYIGTHWKYSQQKRTQKGYYDCSALVWKAYKEKANVNFGSPGYPGVALTEAKWCKAKGRMIKGGMTYKKVMKMTVNPGDLLFKSTDMKKKYKDIYHVEMFTGYFCHSVGSDGTAYYSPIWAARGTYYSWEEGSLLGRPMK